MRNLLLKGGVWDAGTGRSRACGDYSMGHPSDAIMAAKYGKQAKNTHHTDSIMKHFDR